MGEETQGADPVSHLNHDHTVAGEGASVRGGERVGASGIAAAVYPDHDRNPPGHGPGVGGREYIEGQTVLAGWSDIAAAIGPAVRVDRLRARGAVLGGVALAFPCRGRMGRRPAQGAYGGRREGDVFEDGDRADNLAGQRAGLDAYGRNG